MRGSRGSRCGRSGVAPAALTLVLLGACSPIPADSGNTLEEVRGGELLVGAAHHPPFVDVSGGTPTGREVELIQAYAQNLDATVVWETGSETVLVGMLSDAELDVVIGGFDDQTAWSAEVAMTRPYADDGAQRVMLTEPGENALLVDLELFLMDQTGERR